jgi:predicted ATP-grasp superfamily ATP-dependent carboligase
MRILVFEYITGGGMLAETIPASLAREGDLMLGALLRDLSEIPDVHAMALRDARLAIPEGTAPLIEWTVLKQSDDAESRFREFIGRADAVWPIAPETGGVLECLCRMVEAAGKALLTSPAAAVRVAASKLETVRRLAAHGIPVVPTDPGEGMVQPPRFPVVVKPDDGVGCEGARIIETAEEWAAFAGDATRRVVQPLLEGEALSLSALYAHGKVRLLSCNRQHIVRENGGFVLKGCGVNAVREGWEIFQDMADRIAAALPELWGYAGVDLIRSERGVHVLEINPRLTTSYAGLRLSTGRNPAEQVLDLWRHGRLPEFETEPAKPVEIFLEPRHVG